MSHPETVIHAGDGPLTLINVFDVDPSKQQELVDVLAAATDEVMCHRPGFVSANFHANLDGSVPSPTLP